MYILKRWMYLVVLKNLKVFLICASQDITHNQCFFIMYQYVALFGDATNVV